MLEIKPTDIKIITSIVLAVILCIEFIKKKNKVKRKAKMNEKEEK